MQVVKYPTFLCGFDCTTDTGKVTSSYSFLLLFDLISKFDIGSSNKELKAELTKKHYFRTLETRQKFHCK